MLAAGDPRHGTPNGYTNLGCRCAQCTAAHTEALARDRAARVARLRADPSLPVKHGIFTTYTNWGCRCDACREARRVRSQYYRSRTTA